MYETEIVVEIVLSTGRRQQETGNWRVISDLKIKEHTL